MDLEKKYDRVSRVYDLLDWPFEYFRYRHIRPKLCGGLEGKVLDAGVGTGRNLAYFSPKTKVTGLDQSAGQLRRARPRVQAAKCGVTLVQSDIRAMPFEDGSFDSCVSSFLFCVLPDEMQGPALNEILRVLKPGGRVRILEYVYSKNPYTRQMMKLWAPYTEALFGARFDRATARAIEECSAKTVKEEFVYKDTIKLYELEKNVQG